MCIRDRYNGKSDKSDLCNMRELINKIGTFCINRLAELVGMSIILASIFTFISLTTYTPEDPNFIFPENTQNKNFHKMQKKTMKLIKYKEL